MIMSKRGSLWKKWDLHVHTPFTKLNDQYSSGSEAKKWALFCKKIEKSTVFAFGITDYFSVENYSKFTEVFKKKYPSSYKVFFPNVEFRIDSKNSSGEHIQFHVIFSNKQQTMTKLENFFTRLKLVSTDNKNLTNKYCTSKDLEEVGFNKAMVEISVLEKKLKDDFAKAEYLIVGVANGYGSLRPNTPTDGRGSEYAKELDKKCQLFFGNSQNTDFFLNKIDGRSQYNLPPKPVLFGCDAHSFDDLDKKLGISFHKTDESGKIIDYSETTWIKANLTFEGLKQVVYEPKDRIRISELRPEEKEDYQIIDKVKYIDNSFTPNEILINSNLTTIIGGKSTGKSILLRNIAQAIDPVEVDNRLQEVNLNDYSVQVADFSVIWKDGQENNKNEQNGVNKKIIYIPQSYLNRLVDKKEDKTSIDDIIKNVLEQEEDVKIVFSKLRHLNREAEKTINQNIEDLFYIENDIQTLIENIKKIGDKKGVESEIKKQKISIVVLKKKAGMSNANILKYNKLLEEITTLKSTQEKIDADLKLLDSLKSRISLGVFSEAKDDLEKLSSNIQALLQKHLDQVLEGAEGKWKKHIETDYKKRVAKKISNQTKLEAQYKKFKPLLEKAQKSKALNEKIEKLEEENKKLTEITKQENSLEKLNLNYSRLIKTISKNHSIFFDSYFQAKTEILKQRSITKDQDLEFGIEVVFENKLFQERCINDICDQRKLSQFEDVSLQKYKYPNKAGFKNDVEKIVRAILSGSLTLKNSYSRKEAITKLVQNWFVFDYKIKQNGDEISEMSPGKKSFVLLKLLIELDNSRCPILLDQPEDDLDNRSIYNDLVKFIKTKKKERQIIIATHNPNLVVGADSECVIVANQAGNKSKNKTYKFEYVQGALENTYNIKREKKVLYRQGIQEHVCDILEGGRTAFRRRKNRYNI